MALFLWIFEFLKSISVRVCHDELCLRINQPFGEGPYMGALLRDPHIW